MKLATSFAYRGGLICIRWSRSGTMAFPISWIFRIAIGASSVSFSSEKTTLSDCIAKIKSWRRPRSQSRRCRRRAECGCGVSMSAGCGGRRGLLFCLCSSSSPLKHCHWPPSPRPLECITYIGIPPTPCKSSPLPFFTIFYFNNPIKNHQKPSKTIKTHSSAIFLLQNTIENHRKPSYLPFFTWKFHRKPSKTTPRPFLTSKYHQKSSYLPVLLENSIENHRKPSKTIHSMNESTSFA